MPLNFQIPFTEIAEARGLRESEVFERVDWEREVVRKDIDRGLDA